jgi:hypothetical protein
MQADNGAYNHNLPLLPLLYPYVVAGSFAAAYYVYDTRTVPGSNSVVYPWCVLATFTPCAWRCTAGSSRLPACLLGCCPVCTASTSVGAAARLLLPCLQLGVRWCWPTHLGMHTYYIGNRDACKAPLQATANLVKARSRPSQRFVLRSGYVDVFAAGFLPWVPLVLLSASPHMVSYVVYVNGAALKHSTG